MNEGEYENLPRKVYGGDECGATFVPVCEKCGRFVKADATIWTKGEQLDETRPNATCAKCGRTKMLFEGFM